MSELTNEQRAARLADAEYCIKTIYQHLVKSEARKKDFYLAQVFATVRAYVETYRLAEDVDERLVAEEGSNGH